MAQRYDQRRLDETPVTTADLPSTPQRDRRIPARAWTGAPPELIELGNDLGGNEAGGNEAGGNEAGFIRRIHGWLLWRAGPATGGEARYLAVAADEVAIQHSYRLRPDGTGRGRGPSGTTHERFRAWKEDLRDHPRRVPADPVEGP